MSCLIIGKMQHQVVRHVVPGGWSDLLGWLRNRGLEVLSGFIHRRVGMSYNGRSIMEEVFSFSSSGFVVVIDASIMIPFSSAYMIVL